MVRTGTIALVVGAVLARWWGGLGRWPLITLPVLWFSFGGHWVELWSLNWLRPRLPVGRAVQAGARLGVWFVGGTGLGLGVALTAMWLAGLEPVRWPAWWLGGPILVGLELVVHLLLQLRGRPSFYDGRG